MEIGKILIHRPYEKHQDIHSDHNNTYPAGRLGPVCWLWQSEKPSHHQQIHSKGFSGKEQQRQLFDEEIQTL